MKKLYFNFYKKYFYLFLKYFLPYILLMLTEAAENNMDRWNLKLGVKLSELPKLPESF